MKAPAIARKQKEFIGIMVAKHLVWTQGTLFAKSPCDMETNPIISPRSGARETSAGSPGRFPIPALAAALLVLVCVLACVGNSVRSTDTVRKEGHSLDRLSPVWEGKLKEGPGCSFATSPTTDRLRIQAIVLDVADRHGVDGALILAMVMAESGYDPLAVSEQGARGLMQLMPATAEALGVNDSFDPEENLDGGVRYFKALLDRFRGDITLALAAYNAGAWHVVRHSGVPPFKETRRYIQAVLDHYRVYKSQLTRGAPGLV